MSEPGPRPTAAGVGSLEAFVGARLDEVDADASAAWEVCRQDGDWWLQEDNWGQAKHGQESPRGADRIVSMSGVLAEFRGLGLLAGRHVGRHSPAAVRRDVEAKRRILDHHAKLREIADNEVRRSPAGGQSYVLAAAASDHVLRLLALPYSDHPDYRSEWSPSTDVE